MKLSFIDNIINLFYPRVCVSCGELLIRQEDTICLPCQYLLPKTGYENYSDNPLVRIFWGQIDFHAVTAEFFFSKTGKIQNLIHKLKYQGNLESGIFLGQQLGASLKKAPLFQGIDYIIPIPLHPKKEYQRGYNQSFVISQGVEKEINIPIAKDCLYRKIYTSTQTKKSRKERLENVRDIFGIKNQEKLIGRHILLIDDVLTTGATLMAAGETLLKIPNIKISAATVACAEN